MELETAKQSSKVARDKLAQVTSVQALIINFSFV